MKEELYIKGESVDLGDSEITLNFKSNLLGDISKITASNSYTITLPRTNKNIRLLDFPDVAGHESYMMRDYFNAEYYRNGVKLFDAKAVLISCSEDGFDVALTWGMSEKFIQLMNDDKSIQEFADMALPWNSSTTYDNGLVDGQLSHGYIRHNAGIDVDSNRDKIFIHPSVNCMRLLEEIASYYGLTMDWGSYKQYIELLYLPLISQKASSKYNFFEANITGTLDSDIKYVKFTQINRVDGINISNTETYGDVVRIYETSLDWELDILIYTNKHNTLNVVELAFYSNAQYIKSLQISSNDIGLCAYKGVIPFDITEYSNITIRIRINNGALLGIIKSYIKIFSEDVQSVSYNQYYPIGSNLPDISVVDFIKQICWLFGLFAIKSDTGVSFISVNKIIDNRDKAVDWSKKLVPTGWTAKETSYTFGDFAQKNYFRYEENENAKSADGYMVVQNKTLDYEKDLVKLPYTAGGDNGDMRAVPYFKWSDDGTIVELEDCGDRIMQLVISFDSQGKEDARLDFSDLKFQNRVSRFGLSSYQDLIRSPFVIKDTFRLTEIDLKNIDYSIPVYIERYAAFFAIISIKSQGDYSECELLKLL
ncbi:hypothetical protein [Barnesiella intestinihominis]|uniref:hypothetical protein n=1 Tax=Barnesiella intestinihominis TaxID=487174 RepID=UPI0026651C89|nr:hypothetical protein [Barnesiella intestinihominis]